MPGFDVDVEELARRLEPAGITGVRPLTGGASSLTYAATMAGDQRVVVKVAPPGLPHVLHRDVLRQARILRVLGPTAVPVPEVLWEDGGAPPDVPPLFVMSHVEGTSLEPLFDLDAGPDPDPDRDVAERLRDAARTLAALHAVDPAALGLAREPVLGPGDEIDRWCRSLSTVDPALAPGWESAAEALRASQPPPARAAVTHGDFRLGNLLARGTEITAVIDWEIWSVGDPRVDLGWFLVNGDPATYRRPTRYAGTVPPPAELAATYADALGRAVPSVNWFQALACFKSAATWSLIVKHNRRRASPDPATESLAATLPHLLERARTLVG